MTFNCLSNSIGWIILQQQLQLYTTTLQLQLQVIYSSHVMGINKNKTVKLFDISHILLTTKLNFASTVIHIQGMLL